MYNYDKVLALLKERGLKHKDLLEYLGKNMNGSGRAYVTGNIRADKLEKIADFFGVSIDTFFDREVPYVHAGDVSGVMVNGSGHRLHDIKFGNNDDAQTYQSLLEEKDKRIAVLEEMINLLKQNLAACQSQKGQTNSGQQ